MRITQRAMAQTSLLGLNTNLAALQKLQQQLTSGKLISRPSDDPTGTNTSMLTRQNLAGVTQQARNITDGRTFLDATDSALQSMLDQARRVRDLAVQALNGGAQGADSQQAIATEVDGVRQSLISAANQVVQGRPIFGGVTSGSVAYDPSGNYVGLGGTSSSPAVPLNRQVSDVEAIRVDITGPEAFGDKTTGNGKDLFSIVQDIHDHAQVGDTTSLTQDLADLDGVMSKMLAAAADVGTRSARLDTAAQVNSSTQLDLQSKLSDTENVDLPKTIMEMQMQQVGYQAALQVTAQTLQPTLLDFLR